MLNKTFMSMLLYVIFGKILFRLSHAAIGQQELVAYALLVSPNVVGAPVPAVRAALIHAVFTFDSVKKAALTQKRSTVTINEWTAVLSLRLTSCTCT